MDVNLDQVRRGTEWYWTSPLGRKRNTITAFGSVDLDKETQAEEVQVARDVGWNDREVFDSVVQATANRAFNHVLRTFKIEQ